MTGLLVIGNNILAFNDYFSKKHIPRKNEFSLYISHKRKKLEKKGTLLRLTRS